MDNVENKSSSWIKIVVIIVLIVTVITLSILLYARYIGTKNIKVNEIKITAPITNEFKGFKIAHISDIQYGKTTHKKELNELVEKINLTKPDIVVMTGDLINNEAKLTEEDINILVEFLNNINANIKKYAVSGENDVLFDEYENIIKEGNFINLDNDFDIIYQGSLNYILISGIGNAYNDNSLIDTTNYLNENEIKPVYKILLLHKPDVIKNIDESFNLVLAGHSVGGLVNLPFIGPMYLTEGSKIYSKDYYKISDTNLYVSNGIGTNHYSFRLFNRPSFNFYRLTNK